MKIDFTAHIYELKNWTPRKKDELLPFADKFFRQPINSSTRTCILGELNGVTGSIFEFFQTDASAKRVMVVISRHSADPLSEPDARGVLGQFVGSTQKEAVSRVLWARGNLHDGRANASKFLRESDSLTASDFATHGRLQVVADAKGVAVIDESDNSYPPEKRAERLAVLTALCFAYQSVLDAAIDLLADAGRQSAARYETQLREWSRYMSSFYFHEPIKLATIELARFYGCIRDRHTISGLAHEVTEQLKLLADLVRLDRSEAQTIREKSIQFRVGIAGVALALIGATLTFAQVTPKVIADSISQWSGCGKRSGIPSCIAGHYVENEKSSSQGQITRQVGAKKISKN